jgi:hypothetical protein
MESYQVLLAFITILLNIILGNRAGTIISIVAYLFIFLFKEPIKPDKFKNIKSMKTLTPSSKSTAPQKEKYNFNTLLEKEESLTHDVAPPVVDPSYKGSVDFVDISTNDYSHLKNTTTQYGEDKITAYQLKHRGANAERQLAGGYNPMKVMKPMLEEELHNEEYSVWWGNNDK